MVFEELINRIRNINYKWIISVWHLGHSLYILGEYLIHKCCLNPCDMCPVLPSEPKIGRNACVHFNVTASLRKQ